MNDLCDIGVVELARSIRTGSVGAEEVTRAYLRRVERHDPELRCYLELDAERALATARVVDERLRRKEAVGKLAGVPVGLKDIFVTEGLQTSCGSRILEGWIPPYDGTAVARLKAAGAVVLGKLNMDEFAMGSSNENSAYGPCLNPWDLRRVPGGSSGGSAAAVSARLCGAALGTDTGGSIRQPAAMCGAVGIKPTYGRVSRFGVIAFASSLDQVGPLARSVHDCALLLEVIAGHDPKDSTSIPDPAHDPEQEPGAGYLQACERSRRLALEDEKHALRGTRIGVPEEYFVEGMDPEVERLVRAAIAQMEQIGAEVVTISLPHTKYAVSAYYLIANAEASSNLARYDGVRYGLRSAEPSLQQMYERTRQRGFGPEVKRRIMLGTFALSAGYYDAYYAKAQRVRTLIREDFERAFERCDVIATPTSPVAAFPLGERLDDPLQMYLADIFTLSCNLAGLPGLSLPCGFTAEGLPVGLQLLGPPLGEAALLAAAAAYEASTPWHERRPPLEGDR
jgi:aspartyl-tRNA(Asn)/glutamyl-tRNA(Gln) amidotransferase subunit A